MPPAWDPPKLLLIIVSGLHVVGGLWLLGSNVWSQQSVIGKGERGEQINREYSSKVLASKELHYICMHWYQME